MASRPCIASRLSGALLLLAVAAPADVLRFDNPQAWQSWQLPAGLVRFDETGRLGLVEFRRGINAVADAASFVHPTATRGEVAGGIWTARSNPAAAPRLIDGDPETYWQPDPDDLVQHWTVDIDLGRAVLAERIRLHFPDEEGARPLRQFSVFVATGARIEAQDDLFAYELAYTTTRPNSERLVEFTLESAIDTVRAADEGLEALLETKRQFSAVQYVRLVAEEKSPDAALAEIEVIAAGDNVSLGTVARGGSFANGDKAVDPINLFDGQMDTYGNVNIHPSQSSKGGWEVAGLWWQADLGAWFWLDEAFMYWKFRGEALSSFIFSTLNVGTGYIMLASDGRRTTRGDIDFDPLFTEERAVTARQQAIRHFRYIFKPRKVRYLLWHALLDEGWESHPMELMLFTEGHPAQVSVFSDFIDLGAVAGDGRPKAIRSLNWDVDLPPATRMQLRSRTGNALSEVYTFHDRAGNPITEARWNSAPKVLRGKVDTALVVGDDWGPWSNVYQVSGEQFQSASPRRLIQLEMILATDDPQVAPSVASVGIEFEDALVQQALGRIEPRQARPNEATRFTYTLVTQVDDLDEGFDLLNLAVPEAVDASLVEVHVGGRRVEPAGVAMVGDSLEVQLPARVLGDSVQIGFTTRVRQNATVFSLNLGASDRQGVRQSVEVSARRANVVLLPELVERTGLIGDLQLSTPVLTPNGDGVNDLLDIRFVAFKIDAPQPQVAIFDLAGRRVASLKRVGEGAVMHYVWDGAGVAPGLYLCRIDLGAEAGDDTALRLISVAY